MFWGASCRAGAWATYEAGVLLVGGRQYEDSGTDSVTYRISPDCRSCCQGTRFTGEQVAADDPVSDHRSGTESQGRHMRQDVKQDVAGK